MKIEHKEDYVVLRQKEYPKIGDQLDAVLKLAITLRESGIVLNPATEAWINSCVAIKTTYPKS